MRMEIMGGSVSFSSLDIVNGNFNTTIQPNTTSLFSPPSTPTIPPLPVNGKSGNFIQPFILGSSGASRGGQGGACTGFYEGALGSSGGGAGSSIFSKGGMGGTNGPGGAGKSGFYGSGGGGGGSYFGFFNIGGNGGNGRVVLEW